MHQDLTRSFLASLIDHTLLDPSATDADLERACVIAAENQVASLCVRPDRVARAYELLTGTGVPITTVAGFHEGTAGTAEKIHEIQRSLDCGASEIDIVMNWPALVAGEHRLVEDELAEARFATLTATLKVIVESAALTPRQIEFASQVCRDAGADFVKTSTGYHPAGGATVEAVEIIKATVPGTGIKASGGISTLEGAVAMLAAGATRLGSRSTVAILDGVSAERLG